MFFNYLPFLFLLLTIVAIIAANRVDVQVGVSWLLLAVGTLLTAISVLVLHWIDLPMVEIKNWISIGGSPIVVRYGFDDFSWAFAFAMLLVLIGVVFTMPVRLDVAFRPRDWIFDLLFILFGLLPIMAQNLFSLVVAWTLLDFLELSVHISGLTPQRINRQAVMAFAIRMGGSWLLIFGQVLSQQGFQTEVAWQGFESTSALLLLLAAGLRLGIFPVFMPFQQEAPIRRELGTIMRFVVPASSFILLTRLSNLVIPSGWAVILSLLALLASLVGVVMFFISDSSMQGRNYWVIALSGMAVVSVVRGQADAALTWSIALLISGTFLSVHSEKYGAHLLFVIGMFLSLAGIPFTPTAAGVNGLIVLPFNLLDIVYVLVYALLLAGFLMQQVKEEGESQRGAGWMQFTYWLGLAILLAGFWYISVPSIQKSMDSTVWWGGIPSLVLALVAFYLVYKIVGPEKITLSGGAGLTGRLKGDSPVFRITERIFYSIRSLVTLVTDLLEGDSAILWILLLFLMLMTMILQGGAIL